MDLVAQVGGLSAQEKTEFFEKSLGQLTVAECLALVKHLEQEWDVEASPNLGVLPQPPGQNDQEAEEEQTAFDVILTDVGQTKIKVIRAVRQITGQALKEASDSLKALPAIITKGVSKEDAEKIKGSLAEAGATVEIK